MGLGVWKRSREARGGGIEAGEIRGGRDRKRRGGAREERWGAFQPFFFVFCLNHHYHMGVVASGFGAQGQAGHGMETRGFRLLLGVFVRVSFGLGWGLRSEAGSSSRHDATPSGRSVSYVYLCVMKSVPCMGRNGGGDGDEGRGVFKKRCVLLGFSFLFYRRYSYHEHDHHEGRRSVRVGSVLSGFLGACLGGFDVIAFGTGWQRIQQACVILCVTVVCV